MIKYVLSICLVMIIALPVNATIYRYVDKDGKVHFTDEPHRGAETVTLPPVQTYSDPARSSSQPAQTDKKEKRDVDVYKSIQIAEPQNETTSRDNQGRVPVTVDLNPPLKEGDKMQIILDGAPLGEPEATTSFVLQNVLRGSHTIEAQVLDKEGNVVIKTSEPTILFMHRPRTGMTNTTPAPRQSPN